MQTELNDDVISRIALMVKNMYCLLRCRAQRIDNYEPSEAKYGKYWHNTAIMCVQHQINPIEFVEVQFHCLKPYPYLSHMASAGALERYYNNAKMYAAAYYNEFNIQIYTYETMVKNGSDPRTVLLDERKDFDALFIYSVAAAAGFDDLAAQYEAEALAKYLTSVHYDQVYRDIIPEKFKLKALEIREGVHAERLDRRTSSASDTGRQDHRETVRQA